MARYWPSSLLSFLWTETKSRSIKTQKENESTEKNDLRTCLFSSTEKETSKMLK